MTDRISYTDACMLNDLQLETHFMHYNDIEDLFVLGVVHLTYQKDDKSTFLLREVVCAENSERKLLYPIEGMNEPLDDLYIFQPKDSRLHEGDRVKCKLRLDKSPKRNKPHNPFLMCVKARSIKNCNESSETVIGATQLDDTIDHTEETPSGVTDLDEMPDPERSLPIIHGDPLLAMLKDEVDYLNDIDMITAEQYLYIKGYTKENDSIPVESNEPYVDFRAVVTKVQSYCYYKKLLYPREVIEDFITLLRTHDFIVLAGLSGTGKTQLVKSVAEAIGGKAVVIAVKPNWTSGDDLMGYYNPMQRRYMKTEFLEALLDARRHQDRLYLVCLDEMNLARAEYYFADFLSGMEERKIRPSVRLYSSDESDHVRSELKLYLAHVKSLGKTFSERKMSGENHHIGDKERIDTDTSDNIQDGLSLISMHSRIRQMLTSVLDVDNVIDIPENVRFIGSVNVDQTTYMLSPKILDRVHVMKFGSPLHFDERQIQEEIEQYKEVDDAHEPIYVAPRSFGDREDYPEYNKDSEIVSTMLPLTMKYLEPIGIEIGYRTFRQAQLYTKLYLEINDNIDIAYNNILLHKILPRFYFDGNHKVVVDKKQGETVHSVIQELLRILIIHMSNTPKLLMNACDELNSLILYAENNNRDYNFWCK